MIFETYVPRAPLHHFVEFLWFYDGFAPLHTREKLLPDASMELIIDLRDHPKKLYDTRDPRRATEFRRSWLSGMHTGFIVIDASPGSMMGAHFRPGGARPFLGVPLSEFTDQVVPFECVVGQGAAGSLRDQLLEADLFPRKFAVLEAFLLAAGRGRLMRDSLLDGILPEIMATSGRIKDIAAKTGVSQRHFIELFEVQVGLRPKQLQRICRFQRTIQRLTRKRPGDVDLTSVALDCGYYDQSHFIHDFTAFSGHTPSDFLLQPREHANYVIMDPLLLASAEAAAD